MINNEKVLRKVSNLSTQDTINKQKLTTGVRMSATESWSYINGKWYLKRDGKIYTGWYKNNEGWHYFQKNGQMVTNWQFINGKWYYFNGRGIITTGWYKNNEGWHYFNQEGHMQTGWQVINEKQYLFSSRGIITTGWYENSEGWHYFNQEGHMLKGYVDVNGNTYIFKNNGVITTGWYFANDGVRFFNNQGHMYKGWSTINNKTYLFQNNGIMVTGWWKTNLGTHYFNNQGHMTSGWAQLGNVWYLFEDGVMHTGWFKNEEGWHYFDSQGHMLVGSQFINGIQCEFNERGILTTNLGWHVSNGSKQLYNVGGQVVKNYNGEVGRKLVIDVSAHQAIIDWDRVKNYGVDGVILRASYGYANDNSQVDAQLARNVRELERLQIPYGVYHFSYARTIEDGIGEAKYLFQTLRSVNAKPKLGIYYDLEYTSYVGDKSSQFYEELLKKFMGQADQELKSFGSYSLGVYANQNYFENKLTGSTFDKYKRWIANYGYNDGMAYSLSYRKPYMMWQYTSAGYIPGINTAVDQNVMFE
ncbi:GH25 family lysozyme [Breznakia blatticola]|uniref:GH25 family lysozyme n=1 Tax=Breznakia blatticola TaxID=1754012 RepID=UPI001416F14E|nr:GH25 family lysozyme [Breznakia blatticola]